MTSFSRRTNTLGTVSATQIKLVMSNNLKKSFPQNVPKTALGGISDGVPAYGLTQSRCLQDFEGTTTSFLDAETHWEQFLLLRSNF